MKPKTYTNDEILDGARVGLEFEFFSKLKDTEISRAIGKITGKRVVVPLAVPALGEDPKPLYHSPVVTTDSIWKLEPDFSGGKGMFELVTGPLPYKEARKVMIQVMDWIDQFGYTTSRCSIHANISFDYNKIEPTTEIQNMEVLKFILGFDEKPVYKNYPDRESSVYARSVQSIIPNQFFFYNAVPTDYAVFSNTIVPNEKYYGVNFTKREKDYLEFRYMGGKDYEKKPKKVLDTVDYFILSLFNILNYPAYTKTEASRLKKIFKKHSSIVKTFADYSIFAKAHKDIEISVDLKNDPQIIKSYWERIKVDIFDLMVRSGLKKGRINLDTDFSRMQLAKAKLSNAVIKDMDLIDCELEGVINKSNLYFCKISNSRLKEGSAMKENEFNVCKIKDVNLHATNICRDCFIENTDLPINCRIDGGVIRKGEIGAMAEVSDDTNVVEETDGAKTMKAPKEKKEELKDFRWIKKLAKKYK